MCDLSGRRGRRERGRLDGLLLLLRVDLRLCQFRLVVLPLALVVADPGGEVQAGKQRLWAMMAQPGKVCWFVESQCR